MAHKHEKILRSLGDELLKNVAGGNRLPWYPDPKRPQKHVPGSIAQGDTLDNTLTFDQLP